MNSPDFYDRVLSRIVRFSMALGIAGAAVVLMKYGGKLAVGFLAGAIISITSFHGLRRMVESIGNPASAPSVAFFGFRYLLVGGAVYVIVRILEITPMAVFAGLFVSAAAVIIEILYELIYART
jgi:hypothetical protein